MPRKSTAKQGPDAPSAAETATAVAGHPWWPELEVAKVARLVVFRVVYEDRKGLPGAGRSERVNLTPEPLPPAMLTTERQVAEAWGPGYYEVEPRDAANRFVAGGGVKALQIADKGGRVPKFVREFEVEESEDDARDSEEVRRLKLELKLERDARREERAHYDSLLHQQREQQRFALADQRDAQRAERETLGALFEQISKAAQMQHAPQSSNALAPPDWMRDRLQRLEDEVRAKADRAHELELAKLRVELAPAATVAKAAGDEDFIDKGLKALPLLGKVEEVWDKFTAVKKEALEAQKEAAQLRAQHKLGGYSVPTLADLVSARENNRRLNPESKIVAAFRRLYAEGMLPPAYVAELAEHGLTFGAASAGDAPAEDSGAGSDRAALG